MKKPLILASLLVFAASLALAQTYPVQLTAGTAGTSGQVEFNLVADSSSFFVRVNVSLGDSGATIAGKIAAYVSNSSWAATANGAAVTFRHFNGSSWSDVCEIDNVEDTADASMSLATSGTQSQVDFSLSPLVNASGSDAKGNPSFLTFNVAGEAAPLTLVLTAGQSPAAIMNAIAQYLQNAGIGLRYQRMSPTSVRIWLRYRQSFASVQTSDLNLDNGTNLSDRSLNTSTGLIDR
jgi:hypothetical protein